jgi:hypothetical protein
VIEGVPPRDEDRIGDVRSALDDRHIPEEPAHPVREYAPAIDWKTVLVPRVGRHDAKETAGLREPDALIRPLV